MTFIFFANAVLFGVGLAMDAFSVSLANGLNEPRMKKSKTLGIALTFAVFQILMPLGGWLCVRTVAEAFSAFEKCVPWIALLLLLFIGGKMLIEGIKNRGEEGENPATSFWTLMLQGLATSIDALSVGFTIADKAWPLALTEALIIGVVTFFICLTGLAIGKKFGTKLAGKAGILGGIILIAIGLEIFISSFI